MNMDGTLAVEPLDLPGRCALCHRILPSETEASGDLEAMSICGDCKFLLLEDSGTLTQDIQRRTPSTRQTRYNSSSESIENMSSQQFPDMINLARHMQPTVSEHGNQSVDSVLQRTSLRTTPGGSRHWRRVVLSDTESDGFDSVYGEGDIVSYAAYGGDSDASVEVDSFLDNDVSVHPHTDAASFVDSDTDIDPLHADLNQWNSDDDDEFEEAEADENTLGTLVGRVRLHRSLATNGRNLPVDWLNEILSPEPDGGVVGIRISERRRIHVSNPFGNLEEQETSGYVGNAGDYLDARGFEELLERLAETDSSRRGAPPAAVSFVKNLERVVVDEEFDKGGLVCVICKDSVCVGSVVNRLPCLHVYHPSCIMPWLNARNTCPLCRYELPTDKKDYERSRRSRSLGLGNQEMQEQEEEDTSSEEDEDTNEGGGGGRWWFVAVSVVGIGVVLWLGGGVFGGSWGSQRDNRISRRWWSVM